ncbi:TPA: phosphate acyltransferase PlsX [Candidatus Micrarchaeota archaeon]|nr:phosphate acyltransferase PlsX [Candidatus Micrarchaeota archaeon]
MGVRVVVDVMGADNPPSELISGLQAAARRLPLNLILVGNKREIYPHLDPTLPVEVVHAPDVVRMDEPPLKASRKKDSSLVKGIRILAEGRAEAFLSPGNTGAVVATSIFTLGRIPGVLRPGICAAVPTLSGRELYLIDAGATVDCKPYNLFQFAIMGEVYAREILGTEAPKIGLLNVGEEEIKGDKLTREAYKLLKKSDGFAGNVEPHQLISERPVDVVVCSGFAGNLTIKALEGGADIVWRALKKAIQDSSGGRLAALLLKKKIAELSAILSYERYNGAPLLGVKGLVFIAHGRSNAAAMEAAVERTFWAVKTGLMERVTEGLSQA